MELVPLGSLLDFLGIVLRSRRIHQVVACAQGKTEAQNYWQCSTSTLRHWRDCSTGAGACWLSCQLQANKD